MGIIKAIHHIKFTTKSLDKIADYLIKSFGFRQIYSDNNERLLQSGNALFMANSNCDEHSSQIDSVYDIALEVNSVKDVIDLAVKNNVKILKNLERISDKFGWIETARIKSSVGNVSHTVIDKTQYHGVFLPGYRIDRAVLSDKQTQVVKHFDHIAYAANINTSSDIIHWYRNMFGMKRFFINNNDLSDEGFVFQYKDRGMRLKAFEYWKCSETGVKNKGDTCKFVIAEMLNDNAENQIGTFLKEHEGPGIQHIGLGVDNIVMAAENCFDNGAEFYSNPSEYYEIISQNPKLTQFNLSIELLKKNGILLDCESDLNPPGNERQDGLLLQIFSKPIFDKNTFFLELIERRGAKGFGSGNIKALWAAVDKALFPQFKIQY